MLFFMQHVDLPPHKSCAGLQHYGSFRKAASSVNISNPAFSRSIARAEEILGERLFDRESEGAVPWSTPD